MSQQSFNATEEQAAVIRHNGSAFVTACPGAGKTRVMIERARCLFRDMPSGSGVAFLSFTQAAVFELDTRLRKEGLLPAPTFPSFIGTFDSFVWRFLVAPFGIDGCEAPPQVIPDIGDRLVMPFKKAHPLPLSCFCPQTGVVIEREAKKNGFDLSEKSDSQIQAYKTTARNIRAKMLERGQLAFNQARFVALDRLKNIALSGRISSALAARFREVIVDEAQDCNPEDLKFISWLRNSGLPVKVVCDPQQSIYEFRGGVTDHLFQFGNRFSEDEHKALTGNFRSTPNICRAIAQFRSPSVHRTVDRPRGALKDDDTPVYILSYSGTAVPASIGTAFCALVRDAGIDAASSPIVAATKASSAAAAGQPRTEKRRDRSTRLAEAVTDFHFAAGFSDVKASLDRAHEIFLELEGRLDGRSYHQYLADNEIEPASWRPIVITLLRALRFVSTTHADAREWHAAAKKLLSSELTISEGQSISQKLKWNAGLEAVLPAVPAETAMSRSIHSVKGKEFPAVCVVTTTKTMKGILDFLETGEPSDKAEEARKLYVGASRAERLLAIAVPKRQVKRLKTHLSGQGTEVTVKEI